MKAWPAVAGPLVSVHLEAVRFAGGILWVRAEQSVWAHQLTFLRPELLRRLEEALGPDVVTDLRLTTSRPPGPGSSPPGQDPGDAAPRPPRFAELPGQELAAIEARAAEHIRDPELARRWARLEARIRGVQLARRRAGERPCERCGVPQPGPGRLCPVCRNRSPG